MIVGAVEPHARAEEVFALRVGTGRREVIAAAALELEQQAVRAPCHAGGVGGDLTVGELEIEALGDGPRHGVGGLQHGRRVLRLRGQHAAADGEAHGLRDDLEELGFARRERLGRAAAEHQQGVELGARRLGRHDQARRPGTQHGEQRRLQAAAVEELDDSRSLGHAPQQGVAEVEGWVGKPLARLAAGGKDLAGVVGLDDEDGGRGGAQGVSHERQRLLHDGLHVAVLVQAGRHTLEAVKLLLFLVEEAGELAVGRVVGDERPDAVGERLVA